MIPFWIQLVTAVSAGLVSGVLGIALVPYLTKCRMFPPDSPETQEKAEERTREARKPLMGGLLTAAGILFALVLGGTLYLQFSGADRTGALLREQLRQLAAAGVFCGVMGGIGFLTDLFVARGISNRSVWWLFTDTSVIMAAVLCIGYLSFTDVQLSSNHWLAVLPLPLVVCFIFGSKFERETDGALLTVNAISLLALTILLLRESLACSALLSLAAAGACFGTLVWCLHPAKCRIGTTGTGLLSGLVPYLCLQHGLYRALALLMAVFVLQEAFRFFRRDHLRLTEAMEQEGMAPPVRIAILAGITAFCGVMALLVS